MRGCLGLFFVTDLNSGTALMNIASPGRTRGTYNLENPAAESSSMCPLGIVRVNWLEPLGEVL